MLKKLVAISLIISFGITLVRFTIPYASYYTNYNYIVHYLCINRNKPGMHCNGKCQLKKMIKKEAHDHSEHKAGNTLDHNPRIDFYMVYSTHFSMFPKQKKTTFHNRNKGLKPLYFSEPPSPPPQYT